MSIPDYDSWCNSFSNKGDKGATEAMELWLQIETKLSGKLYGWTFTRTAIFRHPNGNQSHIDGYVLYSHIFGIV